MLLLCHQLFPSMAISLLVTTDFSTNSKAGIRFAIQLAAQGKYQLVFYHCLPYLKPTRWSDDQYEAYSRAESQKTAAALRRFVLNVYRDARMKAARFECVVECRADIQQAIIDYAAQIGAAAICIGTRGAGRIRKMFGTNTSALIHRSPVPVFAVPKNYRRSAIKHILYASDLNHLGPELKQVRNIARPFKALITVVHYDYLADVKEVKEKLEKVAYEHRHRGVNFLFRKYNIDKPLGEHFRRDFRISKVSLAVLFTNQKRGWFDKLFLSSKSADVALDTKTPLLIIPRVN